VPEHVRGGEARGGTGTERIAESPTESASPSIDAQSIRRERRVPVQRDGGDRLEREPPRTALSSDRDFGTVESSAGHSTI